MQRWYLISTRYELFRCPRYRLTVAHKVFVGVIDGRNASFMNVFSPGHLNAEDVRRELRGTEVPIIGMRFINDNHFDLIEFDWKNKNLRLLMDYKRGGNNIVSVEHGVSGR